MTPKNFQSGFVAILGRPNVGKSTLLNALLGNKISIISAIPQTTRHQIKGILNLNHAQIVFVDTPGIHSFKDSLSEHLNVIAKRSLDGCDLIIYVVDVLRRPAKEENQIMKFLAAQNYKLIMALNKIDRGMKYFNQYIALWQKESGKVKQNSDLLYYLPVSAKTGENLNRLTDILVENLPQGQPYYDPGTLTDFPLKFRLADIIREKLFLQLKQELPHSLAVEIAEIEPKKNLDRIKVNIYVKRNSQKKIVVGKAGCILKQVGSQARPEIERIYQKKVFLDLWVTVLKDWQTRPRILKELGYWWA